jgi:hypothetical protein
MTDFRCFKSSFEPMENLFSDLIFDDHVDKQDKNVTSYAA